MSEGIALLDGYGPAYDTGAEWYRALPPPPLRPMPLASQPVRDFGQGTLVSLGWLQPAFDLGSQNPILSRPDIRCAPAVLYQLFR
jgi:hypothetical protein